MEKNELKKHLLALDNAESTFDSKVGLMTFHTKKDAYHTKLADRNVHANRDSLAYAVALLFGERKEDIKRAIQIIELILEIQDTDVKSDTYGLWSYYYEETLPEMDAPDRNMADFFAKLLLDILYNHTDKLSDELIRKIKNACRYACASIIRRNEGVQYTNVAITDCYVTLGTGELLEDMELISYGRKKLEKFVAFTKTNGAIAEYNSPTYSPLVSRDLALILKYIKDSKAVENANFVNDCVWEMLGKHFRVDLGQLSGPQSRAYSDYLTNNLFYEIELACDGNVKFDCTEEITFETFWTKSICPPKYFEYFTGIKKPESMQEIVTKGFNYPFFAYAQTSITHQQPDYTIGTYNREEFWNQHRPFLAYIKGANKPYCFRVRFLHDGYDFSSAELHCIQKNSSVLCAANFSSDRGDTHINLDIIKNKQISAEEIALSFELEGDMNNVTFKENGDKIVINIGDRTIYIDVAAAKFETQTITRVAEKNDNKLCIKILLYSGIRKTFNYDDVSAAFCVFAVDFENTVHNCVEVKETPSFVEATWNANGSELKIKTHSTILPFVLMMYEDWQWIDGVQLEKHIDK